MLTRIATAAPASRTGAVCAQCLLAATSVSMATAAPSTPATYTPLRPQGAPSPPSRRWITSPPRSRYGRLREGTAALASPFEVDVKMDEVREALNACGTVQKAWDWAVNNIWGINTSPHPGAENQDTRPKAGAAPYGVQTAFYAPAVHSLFLHLRDSLRSPHAALAAFEATRAWSPESLVLGSTPALYADVIKLHWSLRRDLAGVRDTVRSARRAGLLSTSSAEGGAPPLMPMRPARPALLGAPPGGEDAVLRKQIEIVLDEARREALASPTISSKPKRDSVLVAAGFLERDGVDGKASESIKFGRSTARTAQDWLPWAQQYQLAVADEIATLLHQDTV